MLPLLITATALGAPCGDPSTLEDAATGGWLLSSERACLSSVVGRRGKHRRWASELLMEDAAARMDDDDWYRVATYHVEVVAPEDGDTWVALATVVKAQGRDEETIQWASRALAQADQWATALDPRLDILHRLRLYSALHSRVTTGLDERLVRFARERLALNQTGAMAGGPRALR